MTPSISADSKATVSVLELDFLNGIVVAGLRFAITERGRGSDLDRIGGQGPKKSFSMVPLLAKPVSQGGFLGLRRILKDDCLLATIWEFFLPLQIHDDKSRGQPHADHDLQEADAGGFEFSSTSPSLLL